MLIVDRHAVHGELLVARLQALGLEARLVASAEEAARALAGDAPFDAALVTHDGEDEGLVEHLRSATGGATLPLLGLAPLGRRPQGDERSAFAAVIGKPVKQAALLAALTKAFGRVAASAVPDLPIAEAEEALGKRYPMRILLAEDNLVNQRVAGMFLKRLGYTMTVAANGLEAVAAAHRELPDLILMDLQLPEIDGLEATRRIRREIIANRQPRIVALTAEATPEIRRECLAAGMNDFLSKPVRVGMLREALLAAVRARHPAE